MKIRLVLVVAAAAALAACSETSTGPTQPRPGARTSDDIVTCRSGYHVATRADGGEYCEEDS